MYYKLREVCDTLSTELQNRYFYDYVKRNGFLNLTLINLLSNEIKIQTNTKDVETAYRLATADFLRQNAKLIKLVSENNK